MVLVTQRQAVGGSYDTTTVRICEALETRTVDSGLLLSKNASPWCGQASTRWGDLASLYFHFQDVVCLHRRFTSSESAMTASQV